MTVPAALYPVLRLADAADALVDAYGGDVPDWLRDEVAALSAAANEVRGEPVEGPKPYTVIWRPAWGDAFRGDHVLAADGDVETVMAAAFDVVRAEMGEQGSTEDEIAEALTADQTYDLCAILDGHARFVF